MKIRILEPAFSPYGDLEVGQILTDNKYPVAFLLHLVNDAGAAEFIEYETKVDEVYEPVKKPQSSPSLQQAKASRKRTRNTRKKKARS